MNVSTRSSSRRTGVVWITCLLVLASCAPSPAGVPGIAEKFTRWASYEGDAGATHYSSLSQIDRTNVRDLEVAWSYTIGDNSNIRLNPIIIDSVMYLVGRGNSVAAVHAATGREIWNNPLDVAGGGITNRGIMYWESEDRSERRVITSKGQFLHAIDAVSGRTVASFGRGGRVDLREGLGRRVTNGQSPSPGRIFENLVILGSAPGEAYNSGPGHIRAYDVRTGRMEWIFHTIPQPGEFGYDTWPADAWQRVGGVNAWGGLSVDEERGIVYVPLGSASYDFYGADRLGANLFANSLVALDASTGKRIWHYQTVHHDLWDYDLTATPTLLTVRHEGRMVDVVALATKQGYLFVFDRATGEPLWPIEERPVPASRMPGEQAWPTQPHPTWPRPFAEQSFTLADINPFIPAAERDSVLARLRQIESLEETVFMPPDVRPTMQMPGNNGGANWGSTGADPTEGSFFVISKNVPTVLQLSRIVPGAFGTGTSQVDRGHFAYQQNCQACHLPTRQGQPPLIPSLAGVTERLTPEQITAIIREGRGTMPAFVELTPQDVNGIISYLEAPEQISSSPVTAQSADESGAPVRYQTGYGYFSVSGGMHARKPPYTTLTKYDLNSGEILWQVPVGEVGSLVARGITEPTGSSQHAGGPAITAGGLVFVIAGDKLVAYDKASGETLWQGSLPTTGQGIPAVYEWGGRQYVVVSAGTGGPPAGPGLVSPRAYVAYALPDRLLRGR